MKILGKCIRLLIKMIDNKVSNYLFMENLSSRYWTSKFIFNHHNLSKGIEIHDMNEYYYCLYLANSIFISIK